MADLVLDQLLPPCDVVVTRPAGTFGAVVPLARRKGIMIHFDDSASDASGLGWFRSPEFRLSYNRAYMDDGRRIRITPSIHNAAYHAGVCQIEPGLPLLTLGNSDGFRYGGANAGYIGLAITADVDDEITREQLQSLTIDCAIIWRAAGWSLERLDTDLTGHDLKAIHNPRDDPHHPELWGRLGRKIDPTGTRRDGRPVVDLAELRQGVRTYLEDVTSPIWAGWPS